ncbi:MAG TPA: hypothetical protein VNN77_19905 [candidate division Zixibacteria bacterium]|nr:hypothetical protein [candidate division Zixibacteria bacterium]
MKEVWLEELRRDAERAGLALSDEEIERLAPGIARSRRQASELRELIEPETEPARALAPPLPRGS